MVRLSTQNSTLRLEGELTLSTLDAVETEILQLLRQYRAADLLLDVAGLTRLDTAGVVFLRRLDTVAEECGVALVRGPLPESLRPFFDYVELPSLPMASPETPSRALFDRLGDRAHGDVRRALEFLYLMSDLTWSAVSGLFRRDGIRTGTFSEQAFLIGAQGLPIIALILFLIGGVSTLQASGQLRQFGANIYVADLLAIGITSELGPLMTAIVVAGRSGSAIAAEVATMKFTEEIDALEAMALDPLRMVAVPKMWAMVVTVPLLTTMADLVGLAGGVLTGVLSLELAPETMISRIAETLRLKDVLTGLIKSISFAWIITIISVDRGLAFRGGAAGVGRATTNSVVASLFGIIVLDLLWGLIFYL